MDVKTFAAVLARSLVKRGIPKELAVKHAVSLVRTFDEEDLSEIAAYSTEDEFAELSDSLASLIKDKENISAAPVGQKLQSDTAPFVPVTVSAEDSLQKTREIPTVKGDDVKIYRSVSQETKAFPAVSAETKAFPAVSAETKAFPAVSQETKAFPAVSAETKAFTAADAQTKEIPLAVRADEKAVLNEGMKTRAVGVKRTEDNEKTRAFGAVRTADIPSVQDAHTVVAEAVAPRPREAREVQEIYLEQEPAGKVRLTPRGKKFFLGIALATAPITVPTVLLALLFFGMGIVTLCALMVLALLLVCTEAVAGSCVTLVGIIYGAVEIVAGNMGIGIYEIGLGICCGALSLAVGILTYNFAVIVLPFVLKQLISFEKYCISGIGPMLERFRRECNRL